MLLYFLKTLNSQISLKIVTFNFLFELFMQGHIEAVPLYACMQKRNIKEFSKTALAATLICVTARVFLFQ